MANGYVGTNGTGEPAVETNTTAPLPTAGSIEGASTPDTNGVGSNGTGGADPITTDSGNVTSKTTQLQR